MPGPGGSGPGGCACLGGLLPGGVPGPGGSAPRGVPGLGGVCLPPGGVLGPGGLLPGGCLVLGVVCLLWMGAGVCSGGIPACTEADTPPPPCGQTHACKNITLAKLHCGW